MTTRHLIDGVKKHTNLKCFQNESEIKRHIRQCHNCLRANIDYKHFCILRNCRGLHETKIHEAVIIKKLQPNLNKQVYAKGASFLLRIF